MKNIAQNNDWLGTDKITPPFGGSWDDPNTGIESFINRGFRLVFVVFGLYALLNFVMAAFNFINSQGDAKNLEKAKKLFTNSIVGLGLIAVTFIVAGVIGAVFYGDWDALLNLNEAINNAINP